jgi:aldehyde:ferredoxin oxidoreductase
MYGWASQILRVDLTAENIVKEPLDPTFVEEFLGSRGFNSKILHDEFDPAITDPFDPHNVICIGTGPLSGTLAPGSSGITISVGRLPNTGSFSNDNLGGHFSSDLKYAGYDTIVVKGRSEKPVYLHIYNDIVELRDAAHVQGKDVWQANDYLREETGDLMAQTLVIDSARGNRATTITATGDLSQTAEGGIGAVTSSKNLAAIVVRGTGGVKIAQPEAFMEACANSYDHLSRHPGAWPTPQALVQQYQGRPKTVTADLGVPPAIVDQWLALGLFDETGSEDEAQDGIAHIVKYYQDLHAAADALGLDRDGAPWGAGIGPDRMARLLSAAVGVTYEWQQILACGERICALEQALRRRYEEPL